jgi:virginiamycin B lyase
VPNHVRSLPAPAAGSSPGSRSDHAVFPGKITLTSARRRAALTSAVLACLLAALAAFTSSAGAVQVTEFTLETGSKPFYITLGPDGNLWFTDPGLNKIGRITTSGQPTEFAGTLKPNVNLGGIAAGPEGNLWFTERAAHKIGRITTQGVTSEYASGITENPEIYGITPGPGGNMWFTETFAHPEPEPPTARIGMISPNTDVVTQYQTGPGAYAQIVAGPNGDLWYANYFAGRIESITPAGDPTPFGPLSESECATGAAKPCPYPTSIIVGPGDNIWFNELRGNEIGELTPAGVFSKYETGLPHGVGVADLAVGPEGNVWFTERNTSRVGRITPSGVITQFEIGITPSSEPNGIALGPDENLWVTQMKTGQIARIVPEVPPAVVSGGASSVSSGTATLNGTVRSRGADTHYGFEYGLTTGYGSATPLTDNGDGDNVQSVSAGIGSLAAGRTYHYRLVAVNASGTTYGADQSFTTSPPPPPPPTVSVGRFEMYFTGSRDGNSKLRIARIVVIELTPGEHVSFVCKGCYGSSTHRSQIAHITKVVFKTAHLMVSKRSLVQITVLGSNGSKRVRTYGFLLTHPEVQLKSQQCFLPGGHSPVACPGGPTKHTVAKHKPIRKHRK